MATLISFIQANFAEIFITGFAAGFIVCSSIYGIRAAVNIAVKIFKGRG